ncbi:MAG: membrane protein insertase YidC [Candidatus Omnitrophica bacterium]|nr:membrane protein insertase YidC [Candidatus Omnitrophota bacterium]
MGKRTLLAFSLSLLVIIIYNYYLAQKYPRQVPRHEEVVAQKTEAVPSPTSNVSKTQESVAPSKISAKGQAKEVLVETDLLKISITSSGARIKSCKLKNYPEKNIALKDIQAKIFQIEQSLNGASEEKAEFLKREKEKLELLARRIENDPESAELVSLAAELDDDYAPTVIFPGNEQISTQINTVSYSFSKDKLLLDKNSPQGSIKFTFRDPQGRTIEKTYSFSNSNYIIGLKLKFSGWQEADAPEDKILFYCGPDVGLPQIQAGRRMQAYLGPVTLFDNGKQKWVAKESYERNEENISVERENAPGKVIWTGLVNKYFLTAAIPGKAADSVVIEKNRFGEQKAALKFTWENKETLKVNLYMGPKKETRLKEAGVSLEKSIDYGFFSPIARFIYLSLVFFSKWTGNFGWAIVLLCIATKIVFYPLTHRSFESMQKMQQQMKSIQPEMDALREKYKDNPQKLNKELMDFYRKRGINPLASCQSGCLPLVLQMPVFFALYVVLYNSIELRGAPFFGWIVDLSAKDPYYVLPVLMGISMFVQQKLTGMGAAGGAQQEQAKMMSVMFPILLTWIFASLPSGVVLYWFTFNTVTSLQQLLIKNKSKALATA